MDVRWRISIHEASHAVAARLVGLPCHWVSVGLDDGAVDFPVDGSVASVVALMAGSVGEQLFLGDYTVGGRGDWEQASEWLEYLGYDDADAAMWWRWTLDLLREHVDLIERVATALMGARWLSGDEIDALVY
jgi:hypothetical protein